MGVNVCATVPLWWVGTPALYPKVPGIGSRFSYSDSKNSNPVSSTTPSLIIFYYSPVFPGDEWKILSDNVTDSCYIANALPRGPGYVFRVACINKTGSGPFSDPSPPAFMTMPYEGEKISDSCLCHYQIHGVDAMPFITACIFFLRRLSHSSDLDAVNRVQDHCARRACLREVLQLPVWDQQVLLHTLRVIKQTQ